MSISCAASGGLLSLSKGTSQPLLLWRAVWTSSCRTPEISHAAVAGVCFLSPTGVCMPKEDHSGRALPSRVYLVDPTSKRMLLSRAKPCTCGIKWMQNRSANGSLNQLQSLQGMPHCDQVRFSLHGPFFGEMARDFRAAWVTLATLSETEG